MSMYDSGVVKMIDYIYEKFTGLGKYEDTEEYGNLIDKVEELVIDDEARLIVYEHAFEASRQFFILGFLKAAELFNLDFTYNHKENPLSATNTSEEEPF